MVVDFQPELTQDFHGGMITPAHPFLTEFAKENRASRSRRRVSAYRK
jgi:hypothetical protein